MTASPTAQTALQAVYDLADELDSNHARWAAYTVADRLGVEIEVHNRFSDPPRNRNEEQLAEVRAEHQRLYDFVVESDPALIDAWHFTENARRVPTFPDAPTRGGGRP